MSRTFPALLAALLAASALAGCSGGGSLARSAGLTSGPLPQPQPFVVEARKPVPDVYPAVGTTPAPRPDKVLTPAERKILEDSLRAQQQATQAR